MKRIKFIQQYQQTECGLAVIAMIARFYGAFYSMNDMRKFAKMTITYIENVAMIRPVIGTL